MYSIFIKKDDGSWILKVHSVEDDNCDICRSTVRDGAQVRLIDEVLFCDLWRLEEVLDDAFKSVVSVSLSPMDSRWKVRVAHGRTIYTGHMMIVENVSEISASVVKMVCLNYPETPFSLKYVMEIIKKAHESEG